MNNELKYKFITQGRWTCNDTELLSLAISDVRESYAVATDIMNHHNNSIASVIHMSVPEIMKFKGISEAKAVRIAASMELNTRIHNHVENIKITQSKDIAEMFSFLCGKPYEEFWIVLLNRGNRVIRKEMISSGGVAGTVVDPKKIFKLALDYHASCLIIVHNHPSGKLQPSESDIKITEEIFDAGNFLEIKLLDSVIVGIEGIFSFSDDGILHGKSKRI